LDPIFLYFLAGGLAGGFLCGLSGFGAGLVTLPIVLFVASPLLAAQLAALAGIASQIQAISALRYGLHWRQLLPIVLAGVVGIAIALWLIPPLPIDLFKFGVGCILIAYSLFALALPENWRFTKRHPIGNLVAGLLGGMAGGIAGIPGPPVIMWAAVQSWSATEKRTLIQVFNLVTLSAMLIISAAQDRLDPAFAWTAPTMLPATIAGAILGVAAFRRLNDRRYQQLVIVLLLIAGITMVIPT
jgi:uncharacterized membrane protein YfcA